MKLRSGRYKWLTRPMSINQILPNEVSCHYQLRRTLKFNELRIRLQVLWHILTLLNVVVLKMLEAILLKLPTQDLLNCRSVSRLWKSFASPICRRRHVAAKLRDVFRRDSQIEALYRTFQNTSDLPWSACDIFLGTCTELGAVNPEQFKRFLDTFGPHIRKLKLTGRRLKPDLIKSVLRQVPNLEILISEVDQWVQETQGTEIDQSAQETPKSCSGNRLELGRLKYLEILVSAVTDIELIESICTNARNLQSILVNFDKQYDANWTVVSLGQADLNRLIAAISGIRSIAINILYSDAMDLFQNLTVPELKVKELEFEFPGEDVDDQYYRTLEQFLAGNSNCLEKLQMNSFYERGTAGPLRTPFLPKLKELQIPLQHVSSTTCHIHPFTPNQFPTLKKVAVRVPEEEDGIDRIPIFDTAHFDSVQKLVLHTDSFNKSANPMSTDWIRVFPNLVTLDLEGVTVESYPYIYARMSQLENLSLRVHLSPAPGIGCIRRYHGDANSIICQYPKDTKKKNRGTVAQTPSLSSLTNLKTLTLNFLKCDDIPDSKVHLALLKLHQLDCLIFRNIEISSEVKEKLGEYHGNVEVQPSFRNY